MHGDIRSLWIEGPASRKSHNVIQETQRPTKRPVLIVDLRVHVIPIRSRNQSRRSLVILLSPRTNLELRRHLSQRLNLGIQRQSHKQPLIPRKSLVDETAPKPCPHHASTTAPQCDALPATIGACRSHASEVDARSVRSAGRWCIRWRSDEEVADDTLAALINEEAVPEDTPPLHRRIPRQNLGIRHSAGSSPLTANNPTQVVASIAQIRAPEGAEGGHGEKCLRSRISTGMVVRAERRVSRCVLSERA